MRNLAAAVLAMVCLSTSNAATAQYYTQGTVGGNGVVRLSRTADRLRMQVDVLSRAGDIREALDGLKIRSADARTKLVELGASEESLQFGEPTVVTEDNGQRQQIEQMIAQSLRNSGRGKKPQAIARPVTVSARLTAEWLLDSADTAEQLVKSHELQQAIRDADVSGSKEATQLTPEEQEVLEESQETFRSYNSYGEESKPGEPVFYFVASISEEDYQKALTDGFQKAKTDATRLATATGSKLGKLESLSVTSAGTPAYSNFGSSQDYRVYQMLQRFGGGEEGESPEKSSDRREAVGVQPGVVTYNLTVSAGFGLE